MIRYGCGMSLLSVLAFVAGVTACAKLPGTGNELTSTGAPPPVRDNVKVRDPLPDGVPSRGPDQEPASTAKTVVKPKPMLPAGGVGIAHLDQDALAVWNDPTFRKRFIESYIAETDIEPALVGKERERMIEVIDLMAADRPKEAADLIKENFTAASSAAFDVALANIYRQADQTEEAIATYRTAIEKHPKFRRAWNNLGQVYFQTGDQKNAARAFARVVELGGGDAFTYGLLGAALSASGSYVAAESAFRNATMLAPDKIRWRAYLADTFLKQERYAEAAALFERLIAESPNRPDFWLAQGEAYARLDRPMKAAENFEVADQLGGATIRSLTNLGAIYANKALYDLSVDAYLKMLEKGPDVPPAGALRAAQYLIRNGAFADSRKLLDGIDRLRGDRLDAADRKKLLRCRVSVAKAEGLGDEEARVLDEIVTLDPMDGDALIQLGAYCAEKNENEKAVFYYERAARLEKYEARAKLRHAKLLVRDGKYADAIPLLRRAQAAAPNDRVEQFLQQVERFAKSR